ncbi:MAG: helix-turn-helix transcriptional regulator [Tannerellaceae bacterium]
MHIISGQQQNTSKSDFFIKQNSLFTMPDKAYSQVTPYLEAIEAYARTTYHSVYIIDYYKRNFLYVSDNPLFLCGLSVEEVKALGYDFYFKHVAKEDLSLLLEINQAGFSFFENISIEERTFYTISYNFHLIHSQTQEKVLVNQKLTPLKLAPDGKIWLGLCAVSLASNSGVGDIHITCTGHPLKWTYSLIGKRWNEEKQYTLTETEKTVIRLANQGYSLQEIAQRMNKAVDTVKVYRKTLFQKLNVGNISEAIAYVTLHKLI